MNKISLKGNYLHISLSNGNEMVNPKKDVIFYRIKNGETFNYRSNNIAETTKFKWNDFVKEDDTPFSDVNEFEKFVTENTGNFNGGGSAPEPSEKLYKELAACVSQPTGQPTTWTVLPCDFQQYEFELIHISEGQFKINFTDSREIDLQKILVIPIMEYYERNSSYASFGGITFNRQNSDSLELIFTYNIESIMDSQPHGGYNNVYVIIRFYN